MFLLQISVPRCAVDVRLDHGCLEHLSIWSIATCAAGHTYNESPRMGEAVVLPMAMAGVAAELPARPSRIYDGLI